MNRRLATTFAAVTLLAACGSDDSTSQPAPAVEPATSATSATAAPAGPAEQSGSMNPALAFSAPLVGGGEIDLAELGDKPVLLWFWAPW